ncbi:hypothetical protein [Mucilaginibacter sp. AK015]|uniref:hypothetical protein n=1 Tax=Mucilaginibacter sp. AK015 TaxID=2723072 RepID=UPI001621253A|nr:hypothetical protein [Mucilaginibacter sp. AK015]MBB5396254.1 hypothetical protein [Mucilaginibacter sp. AK015]
MFTNVAYSQSQQGSLKGDWTDWETVYTEQPNLKVEISFNFSPCDSYGNSNASFWRIRSNFNRPKAWLTFSFNSIACGGKESITNIFFQLDKPGITDDLGDHFRGYRIKGLNLPAKITDYGKGIKNNALVNTTLNTYTQTFNETYSTYDIQLSKVQNQASKQQYQAALQNAKTQFDKGYRLAQQYAGQGNQQKAQEQLNYLKKVQQQFDGNLNLLNDVVEQQGTATAGSEAKPGETNPQNTKPITLQQPASVTQQTSVRQSAAEKTFQEMTPVRQSLAALLDQTLVDKEKLKDDPNAAASHNYAKAALNSTTSTSYVANSAASLGFSIIGEIQKEKAFKERMKMLEIRVEKERVQNAMNTLNEYAEPINRLTSSSTISDSDKVVVIYDIQQSCKPLLVVACNGTQQEMFDASSLSHKLFSMTMSKEINSILKKARNDPDDENSFTATQIYTLGTWRRNALENEKIDKNKELAVKTIAEYKTAKSNLNNTIKQIRADFAAIIVEESFNPASIENLTDWDLRCQELLKQTAAELKKGNAMVALDKKNQFFVPNLLLGIEAKIIHLRCSLYQKGTFNQQVDYDQILNDYRQFYKVCIAGMQ